MRIKVPFGYRRCYTCQVNVKGRRTQVCPTCQGHLGKNHPKPIEEIQAEGTRTVFSYPEGYTIPDNGIQLIHIPAGEPPIKLIPSEGLDFPSDDDLREWGGNVRQEMINNGLYIRNDGLTYWARKQLNKSSQYAPRGDEMIYVGMVLGELPDITTRTIPA
jgi:hypothetical protein